MSKEELNALLESRKGQNPMDYLGHVFTSLTTLPQALGTDAVIDEILSDKFWKEHRQKIPDVVAKLMNFQPEDPWIKGYYLHIELVDRLRPKLHEEQTVEYEKVLRAEFTYRAHIIHVILVIGPVPPKKPVLRFTTDQSLRPNCATVIHLDSVQFSRLSAKDRRSRIGRILRMIVRGAYDPRAIISGVRAAVKARSKRERKFLTGVVILTARSRPEMREAIVQTYNEEASEMSEQTWAEALASEEEVQAALWESDDFKQELQRSARDGEKRGEKRGERRTRVDDLERIMAARKMPLSDTHLAKLRRLSCDQLPDVELATLAKSANDFARKAGLTGNGSGK